jgi:DNA-binding NarL/FixJ family response regulator
VWHHRAVRALIVDDHEGFRAAARVLLGLAGHDVIGEAIDGEDAIDQCARLVPELVLLDVCLPDTDGFTLSQRLAGARPRPQVVLVTSRRLAGDRRRAAASPVCGLIVKDDLSIDALAGVLDPPR